MMKGISHSPEVFIVRMSVGGKQYFIGKFKTEKEAETAYENAIEVKKELDATARKAFEEFLGRAETRTSPTPPAEKKRRRADEPVVTQDAAPVKAPAPVEQPRRRRAPAPTPTPTLEPRPSSTAMLLGAHDTYLEQRHKSLPTYEYTHGDTQAWHKGESVELDDYESTVDIELDPEHIYWMDMSTKRFVFKTYID